MKKTHLALAFIGLFISSQGQADTTIDSCINAIAKEKSGDIIKLESLKADGKRVYEFEVEDENGFEWEFMCDAASGKLIEVETEVSSPNARAFKAKLIEDDAVKIALESYPGIVEEVEYEVEANGNPTYEIDIKQQDGSEKKVEVDGLTGEIIEVYTEQWEIGVEADERS